MTPYKPSEISADMEAPLLQVAVVDRDPSPAFTDIAADRFTRLSMRHPSASARRGFCA
jgi:hypothetical protein